MATLYKVKNRLVKWLLGSEKIAINLGEFEPRYDADGELYMLYKRKD